MLKNIWQLILKGNLVRGCGKIAPGRAAALSHNKLTRYLPKCRKIAVLLRARGRIREFLTGLGQGMLKWSGKVGLGEV